MTENRGDSFRYYFQPHERFTVTVELAYRRTVTADALCLSLERLSLFLSGHDSFPVPGQRLAVLLPIAACPGLRITAQVVRWQKLRRGLLADLVFLFPASVNGERAKQELWRFLLERQRQRIQALRQVLNETRSDAAGTVTSEQPSAKDAAAPRILIVDDDDFTLTLLESGLTRLGFQVTTAASGEQAIALYEQMKTFDLVLLDVLLPGLDGPETLEALRRFDPRVRCCFITVGTDLYSENELVQRGGTQVFKKPLDPLLLANKVRALLTSEVETAALAARSDGSLVSAKADP